ncbi:Pentatricopeptide repeat-containing protein [Spatholobus suberectus]|nr:Pentatricopeptide repeat-containing protein [Spatholobus suberectus]
MASTPTPPPHFSSIPLRPSNKNQRHHHNQNRSQHHRNNRNRGSSSTRYYSSPASTIDSGASVPSTTATTTAAFSSSLSPWLGARKTQLQPEFSGRRSNRNPGKVNSGIPKAIPNNQQHSKVAEEKKGAEMVVNEGKKRNVWKGEWILTGWGKHSKVVGNGPLKKVVEALLKGMGAPFQITERNLGRFISKGPEVAA